MFKLSSSKTKPLILLPRLPVTGVCRPLTFSIIPLPTAIPKDISSSATLMLVENNKYIKMKKVVGKKKIANGYFFIEEMLPEPIAEMFISIRQDKIFGDILVLGMGGSLTELYRDTKTFILPTSKSYIIKEIKKMNFFNLINGFRSNSKVDLNMVVHEIFKIIKFHQEEVNKCHSIEINPVFVYKDKMIASDCVLSTG